MSTGYGWDVKGRYVRRCSVRPMYLSASEVAVSILGAQVFDLYLYPESNPPPGRVAMLNFAEAHISRQSYLWQPISVK